MVDEKAVTVHRLLLSVLTSCVLVFAMQLPASNRV